MREKPVKQQNMFHALPRTQIGRESETMSNLLPANLQILDVAHDDLAGLKDPETGRVGMTAEQVFRYTNCYRELIEIAIRVKRYGLVAMVELENFRSPVLGWLLEAWVLAQKLERVIDQTRRRVIGGEKVAASEKVVSFFECHTDIIEKGKRETTYGHKLFLVGGASGLVVDCVMERGNPADSSTFLGLVDRQGKIYGRLPRQVSADGGFASRDNLSKAKERGISDVSFSKRKGLAVLDMVKSNWVYMKLRDFRAEIEANISVLKRPFGLTRCTWSGWAGFKQYARSAVFSYDLLTLERLCATSM